MSETNKNIPCELIRDLFPSYIDGLTDQVTNREIEEHTAGCPACAAVLDSMKNPETEPDASSADTSREIDFLRKNKRRNLFILLGSLAGALLLAVGIIGLRLFVIGEDHYSGWIAWHVQVSGSDVTLDGCMVDSAHGVSKVTFTEENGVVTASVRAVIASPLYDGDFRAAYTAKEPVREVRLDNRIIWSEGQTISHFVSTLYQTRHDYMGSMSDNARTADVLNMTAYLGGFSNELKTSATPYAWVIKLNEPVHPKQADTIESDMDSLGYVLLALIGNLDEVSYEYTLNGKAATRTVTSADASAFLGQDIKNAGRNIRVLAALVDRTGLDTTTYPVCDTMGGSPETEQFNLWVVNSTDEYLRSLSCDLFFGDSARSSQSGIHADNSLIQPHETMFFSFLPEEMNALGGDASDGKIYVVLSLETADGKLYEVKGRLRISGSMGEGMVELIGNTEQGFSVRQ